MELSTEKLSKTEETTRHVLAKKRTENPVKYYEQFRRSETTIIVPSWTPPVWAIVSGKAGWLQKNGEVANDIKILTHLHIYHVNSQVRKVADLDFVTAPHKIPGGEDDDFTW